MKKYIVLLVSSLFVAPAMAAESIICKNVEKASGQGYEVVLFEKNAEVLVNGKKVADLLLKRRSSSKGGDQLSVSHYFQPTVNGLTVTLSQGGITGRSTATVSRGGFAGYTVVAHLTDCK